MSDPGTVHFSQSSPEHNQLNKFNNNVLKLLSSNGTTITPYGPNIPDTEISEPICQAILYDDIAYSSIRIWDLIILGPNALFLMFLIWKMKTAITKLRSTDSPIFTAFYVMVLTVAIISVLRCIVAMTVNAADPAGDNADKAIWLILRFFLLAMEMSIVIFGIAFGHLDSNKSIQRVLLATTCIALIYSTTQGTLEFTNPDPKFHVQKPGQGINVTAIDYDIFGHGGMIFWLTSSLFFFAVYTCIFILPWTSLKEKLALPPKKSFYWYCFFLATLNLTQAVGSGLLYGNIMNGMCVVDLTAYIYFTCFAPLVYVVFLHNFLRTSQTRILFSYKNQQDEVAEDDNVSMPYAANRKADDTDSFVGSYDSTHFDRHNILSTSVQNQLIENSMNAIAEDFGPPSFPSNSLYQANA